MKKIFMLFALVGLVGLTTIDAQTCSKSKAECTVAATKAATASLDIEKRVCEESGKVSFVRKSVCEKSGKTSYTNVEYNAETKKFVNISPTHTTGKAAKASCCTGKEKGACCAGKAKTTSAKVIKTSSASAKKGACCSSKSKASCSKKTTTAVKKSTSAAKVVKVSND